jgi:hypothetical protein
MIKTYFLNSQKAAVRSPSRQSRQKPSKIVGLGDDRSEIFSAPLFCGTARCCCAVFDVRTIDEFERFVRLFSGADFFNYAGGVSPRRALSGGVYTSTEYPPHLALALHNELSYSDVSPRHLYFFCLTAPEAGGATTLGDSRRILQNICPKTVGLFKLKNVRYDRNLPDEKGSDYSWQAAFETDDKETVENHCRE